MVESIRTDLFPWSFCMYLFFFSNIQRYSILFKGPVSFQNRQRQAETRLSQFRIDNDRQYIQTIAEFSRLLGYNTICLTCRSLIWSGAIPIDTEQTEVRRLAMNIIEILLITVSSLSGLILAIYFLTFNIIHRHQR